MILPPLDDLDVRSSDAIKRSDNLAIMSDNLEYLKIQLQA